MTPSRNESSRPETELEAPRGPGLASSKFEETEYRAADNAVRGLFSGLARLLHPISGHPELFVLMLILAGCLVGLFGVPDSSRAVVLLCSMSLVSAMLLVFYFYKRK